MALVVGTALTRFVVAFPVPPPPVPLEQEAPWRIVNLAPDAGVARRMVFDIAFETNNTAWLAVSDGLRCYDGYTWRHFTTADGLPSNFIRTVTVTPDGAVWVGTDHGAGVFGVSGFDARGTTDHLAGPNVRRIVATRDGSLWFCCDRWPDATAKGGLTRLKSGNWETFAMSEGLPSDHVLNLFEESKGRILVLTTGGPAVFTGGRWTPLRDPGFPVGDHTWDICETSDGSLFAQGFDATLIRTGNRWERVRDDSGSTPLCVTRDGAVIRGLGMRGSPRFFGRWTGEGFAPASAVLPEQATDFHVIRQAPDGAVWSVGRGSVIRWEYEAGPWRWWPDLTAPVLQDTEGRMWFASRDEVLFKGDGPPIPVPGMRLPLAADQRRGVWGASAHGVVRWTPAGLDQIPESVCGIDVLRRAIPDPSGCVWFSGRRGDGAEVIACFDGSRWIVLGPEAHGDLSNNSAVADPVHGIWLILAQGSTTDYEVAHATTNGVKRCSIDQGKPRTRLPLLCATRSRLFLLGYNGLWASPLGETLRFDPVQSAGPSVFTGAASQGESAAFVSQEGPDGGASILLWRDGGWLRHAAAYGEGLALNPGGWAMVADGSEFLLWHITTWASPTYISLPTETSIISMARSSEGDYWLGTPQGVFQLVPEQSPPQTLVSGPGSCVEGSPAFAFAKGIAPFTSQSRPARFSFSWRFDDETWTGYEDWPAAGLLLSARQPGRHTLQARARDGLGNEDPSPAVLQFEVRSLPIQDRPWFRPALTFAGLVLTALTVALFVTMRRLRRQALQLEEQVQSRTAELRADIERRERVEEALRQSEQRFQLAMDANRDGLWDWNVASGAVYFSPGYSAILGYAVGELVPHVRSWHELLHPEDKQAALHAASECVENRTPEIEVEFRMRARDGSWRWILSRGKAVERDARGHALRMVGTHTDVTDRRRAEAERERLQVQLTHAQKMESVGRLAGGVAHDFNNMLQAILGNATLALEEQAPGSSLHECLTEIQKAARHSTDLTRQLLAFARRQTIAPRVLDLNETVEGMLKMLRRLIGENIQLCWHPGPGVWPVRIDPSQLDQILANLCVNSRDAISGVGTINIRTSNVTLPPGQPPPQPDVAPGDYVVLSVTDDGCGMDAATLARVFEPFFTTKGMGKGTGLGLATVHGVVHQNNGFIQTESQPGVGTTFRLHFPRSLEPTETESEPVLSGSTDGCGETILVVEDEPAILKLACALLERSGYTVLPALTPAEALDLGMQHPHPIRLLVTDVIMPQMNGRDLARHITRHHPTIRCLFMSGYTADVIAHHGVLEAGVHFIQKPFTPADLAAAVRRALDAPLVS